MRFVKKFGEWSANNNQWNGVHRLCSEWVQGQNKVDHVLRVCIIHEEFVPAGQTENAAFYEEVLKRLLERIRRFEPVAQD